MAPMSTPLWLLHGGSSNMGANVKHSGVLLNAPRPRRHPPSVLSHCNHEWNVTLPSETGLDLGVRFRVPKRNLRQAVRMQSEGYDSNHHP